MISIIYYRKMKNIDRLSMMFKNRPYNLLEHQYMVLVLFRRFASLEDVQYDMNVLDIIMNHDSVEAVTGDLPWNVKNFSLKTKEAWEIIEEDVVDVHFQLEKYTDKEIKKSLNERQYDLFKMCDVLDLFIFVKEEIALGNTSKDMKKVEENCFKIFGSVKTKFPNIQKFIETYEY